MEIKVIVQLTIVGIALWLSLAHCAPARNRRSGGFPPSPFFMCPSLECWMEEMTLECQYEDRYVSSIRGMGGMECPGCPACRDKSYLQVLIRRHMRNIERLETKNDKFDSALSEVEEALASLRATSQQSGLFRGGSGSGASTSVQSTGGVISSITVQLGKVLREQRAHQMQEFLESLKANVGDVQALIDSDYSAVQRDNAADIRPNGEYFEFINMAYSAHMQGLMFNNQRQEVTTPESSHDDPGLTSVLDEIQLLLSVIADVKMTTRVGRGVALELKVNSDHYYDTFSAASPLMLRTLFYSLEENDNILVQAFNFWGEPGQIRGLATIATLMKLLDERLANISPPLTSAPFQDLLRPNRNQDREGKVLPGRGSQEQEELTTGSSDVEATSEASNNGVTAGEEDGRRDNQSTTAVLGDDAEVAEATTSQQNERNNDHRRNSGSQRNDATNEELTTSPQDTAQDSRQTTAEQSESSGKSRAEVDKDKDNGEEEDYNDDISTEEEDDENEDDSSIDHHGGDSAESTAEVTTTTPYSTATTRTESPSTVVPHATSDDRDGNNSSSATTSSSRMNALDDATSALPQTAAGEHQSTSTQ